MPYKHVAQGFTWYERKPLWFRLKSRLMAFSWRLQEYLVWNRIDPILPPPDLDWGIKEVGLGFIRGLTENNALLGRPSFVGWHPASDSVILQPNRDSNGEAQNLPSIAMTRDFILRLAKALTYDPSRRLPGAPDSWVDAVKPVDEKKKEVSAYIDADALNRYKNQI